MKKALTLLLSMVMIFSFSILISQEKTDLTGTWKGATYVEGADIELLLTLVLDHKGSAITGKLNDDMGYIDTPISEGKLANNVLTFKGITYPPEGETPIVFTLTVTGDQMKGSWKAGEYTGEWTAQKEKKQKIDFTGTWYGPINTPDGEDNATWTVKYQDGVFSGNITDELGYMDNAPLKNFVIKNNTIALDIVVSIPEGDMTVKVKGTIKGDTIEGTWEIPDMGDSGTWSASKKK